MQGHLWLQKSLQFLCLGVGFLAEGALCDPFPDGYAV